MLTSEVLKSLVYKVWQYEFSLSKRAIKCPQKVSIFYLTSNIPYVSACHICERSNQKRGIDCYGVMNTHVAN